MEQQFRRHIERRRQQNRRHELVRPIEARAGFYADCGEAVGRLERIHAERRTDGKKYFIQKWFNIIRPQESIRRDCEDTARARGVDSQNFQMKTADELSDELGWTAKPEVPVKREPLRLATAFEVETWWNTRVLKLPPKDLNLVNNNSQKTKA